MEMKMIKRRQQNGKGMSIVRKFKDNTKEGHVGKDFEIFRTFLRKICFFVWIKEISNWNKCSF